jgi:hypothetical protein
LTDATMCATMAPSRRGPFDYQVRRSVPWWCLWEAMQRSAAKRDRGDFVLRHVPSHRCRFNLASIVASISLSHNGCRAAAVQMWLSAR